VDWLLTWRDAQGVAQEIELQAKQVLRHRFL
jgi:hypothetical protein